MSGLVPPSCYLKLVDKLLKLICRVAGPSLTVSLETLSHCRNIASLNFFYKHYFGRCSSELGQLVPLPHSQRRPSCWSILIDFMRFLSLFLDVTRISVPRECFPLTYNLNGMKSRINRYLLTAGSF